MFPKLILTSAPAALPVYLEDVKTFLRVDGSSEDALISALIRAASQRLELLIDQKFVTQTWEMFYDCYPRRLRSDVKPEDAWWDGTREGVEQQYYVGARFFQLPFGPVQSATFKVYDDADVEYTFDSSKYQVDTASRQGRIALRIGEVWPTITLRQMNGIKITAIVGMGNGYTPAVGETPAVPSQIPMDVQEAIKQTVGIMYEHRGDEMPNIPTTATMLLEPYRKIKL